MEHVSDYTIVKKCSKCNSRKCLMTNQMTMHVRFIDIGCPDNYPRKMSTSCKRTYSCAKLARQNKCQKSFGSVLSSDCKKKISKSDLRKRVSQYCLKSCRTRCSGK